MTLVDLSHVITDGMTTDPGLPTPEIGTHLSREAAEEIYGPGITFQIGLITLCTNTGTYLDVPFHRFADGHDLTETAAIALRDAGVACVGIDSLNIDATATGERPVHTTLLRAEIPIIEHLTALATLPRTRFRFTAVPPKIAGAGTFTVRAYATVPD